MAYFLYSPIHGEDFVKDVKSSVASAVGELKEVGECGPSFPLIIHATGGTTATALELVERCKARGAVLVGFGEHNSFASALHTKAELEARGLPAVAFHCPSYRNCREALAKARRVANTASSLIGAKAVLIGVETAQARVLRERFGWSIRVVPLEEFEKLVDSSDPDREALALFGDEKVAKIAAALSQYAAGADVVAIQCFPFLMKRRYTPCLSIAVLNSRGKTVACEGDLASGFLMLMARGLTGSSGWIANVVKYTGAEGVFAHCTISLDMAKSWRVTTHFESGFPYGLVAELRERVYTVVSISPRLDRAALGTVEVVKSGNFLPDACRTQAFVKFDRHVRLEAEAPANHHVFIPGDVVDEAEAVLRLSAIPTSRY
ncbi:L-fucose isomerase-related protein [Pyrobaculum oguniense TE7]|uniref:L-fucose isomerase-related protein n=1 Tax=Pyrobaculum oguniense (strain DSM 13380 / JCM 10595 / TE7) TaxID=698757 RepID=H6QD04_PYROT|nr:L-fucose isomerase-related protein [Pyrobaculum oguniense TE7]